MPSEPNLILLRAGKFDTTNGSGADNLKQIFAGFAERRPERLVLHFHGGLVSRQAGLLSAGSLAQQYSETGAESLFVIWESGVSEVISQKLPAIFQEDIFQVIHRRVSQFVRAKLDKLLGSEDAKGAFGLTIGLQEEIQREIDKGTEMFGDIPFGNISPDEAPTLDLALSDDEKNQIQRTIDRDTTLKQELRAITPPPAEVHPGAKSAAAAAPKATLMDQEILADIVRGEAEGGKFAVSTILLGAHIVRVVGAVIWRFAKRRHHGPYLTIVEEIMREFYVRAAGRFLWLGMKDSIDGAFKYEPDCGGAALVRQMQELWQAGAKPCVTLIGHSAGAIYVARLLRELHEKMDPGFRTNVVFIAPACTFAYLARSLDQAGSRLANLRIFGMGDKTERKDAIASVAYPASLLYFVSGVLEDNRDEPLAGMERYYSFPYVGSGFGDIEFVKAQAILSRPHAYAWAQTSGFDGANCDMTSHGGWADGSATLSSIKFLIQKACGSDW